MQTSLVTLHAMPTAEDFYKKYWNKQPFLVRSAISEETIAQLICADELAGLAMEESVNGRLVETDGDYQHWTCRFSPFTERELTSLPKENWSLLVQNVEQFHPETSALLAYFNFAPRWMIDDIMVSLSAPGGSVGPHMDSYHVFLVQGQGVRTWTIGGEPITQPSYVDNPDLKILDVPIRGDAIEVRAGDVLYVPPHVGHQGTTLSTAMTFSVGFLGPKLSELFGSYAAFLAEREAQDLRYVGANLSTESAGCVIGGDAVGALRGQLSETFQNPEFDDWLVSFFTEPGLEEVLEDDEADELDTERDLLDILSDGVKLIKREAVKFALTKTRSGKHHLGFSGQSCVIDDDQFKVITMLVEGQALGLDTHQEIATENNLSLLLKLHKTRALEIFDHTEEL